MLTKDEEQETNVETYNSPLAIEALYSAILHE